MSLPSTSFVVILGIATVFIGLIGLIILCKVLGVLCNMPGKKSKNGDSVVAAANASISTTNSVIENRQEIIAAVSAALAEELGTDVSAIRILSFKKI